MMKLQLMTKVAGAIRLCARALLPLAALGLFPTSSPAAIPHYVVTDLGPGDAYAINNRGQIVGADGQGRAFLYQEGAVQYLDTLLGLEGVVANDINDAGDIVGAAYHHSWQSPEDSFPISISHAFIYSGGSVQDLGALVEAYYATAFGAPERSSSDLRINNRGEVVGSAGSWTSDSGQFRGTLAFRYSSGTVRDYDPTGMRAEATFFPLSIYPSDINDNGTISAKSEFIAWDDSYTETALHHGCSINNREQFVGYHTERSIFDSPPNLGHTYLSDRGDLGMEVVADGSCGINEAGQVVGNRYISDGVLIVDLNRLLSPGTDAVFEVARAINDAGQIVGRGTVNGESHALLLTPVVVDLVDPVAELLYGRQISPALTADRALPGQPYLADLSKGRPVFGVAADGVAQLVLRIAAKTVGEEFDIRIASGQCADPGAVSCGQEYGVLFDPRAPPAGLFTGPAPRDSIRVAAVETSAGPMAFAAYRAPLDFVRSGFRAADEAAAERAVRVAVTSLQNGAFPELAVSVVRPPVVLIHDGFSDPYGFAPLPINQTGTLAVPDGPFSVSVLDYSQIISEGVSRVTPPLSSPSERDLRRDAVGVAYNAPLLLNALRDRIEQFRTSTPHPVVFEGGYLCPHCEWPGVALQPPVLSWPVAAVRADVVAHGLGGLMARGMSRVGSLYNGLPFRGTATYGQGYVHKLITVATPHQGSALYSRLLDGANECVRELAARTGNHHFSSVTINGRDFEGAAADQQGYPLSPSPTLERLMEPGEGTLRAAFLAGRYDETNDSADIDSQAAMVKTLCGTRTRVPGPAGDTVVAGAVPCPGCTVIPGDFLADKRSFADWQDIFGGLPSDAIVPVDSAVALLPGQTTIGGTLHGRGTTLGGNWADFHAGFLGPVLTETQELHDSLVELLNARTGDDARFVDLP